MKHFSVQQIADQRNSQMPVASFQQHLRILSLLLKEQHQTAAEYLLCNADQTHAFIRFIERHNLKLLVFSLLDGSPVRRWVPQEYLRELKRFSLQQWAPIYSRA